MCCCLSANNLGTHLMGCSPRSAAYRLKEQFRAAVLCVCCRAVLELLEKAKTYFLVAAGGRRK